MAAWSTNHTPPGFFYVTYLIPVLSETEKLWPRGLLIIRHLVRNYSYWYEVIPKVRFFVTNILQYILNAESLAGENETAQASKSTSSSLTGNEVVISGISGIFPSSNSILQFKENLYNNVDMVTKAEPRWVFNHPELSKHLGKVEGIAKFDAQFFKVHYKQAITMEPMSRMLLEHAYSAVYDSGINPIELRGKRVGVFIGSAFSESEKVIIFETIQKNGFGISGCNRAMYANRISYWMDSVGPSYSLDVACASSMACLEHAYLSITSGHCDAAIVGGCSLCMHPNVSLNIRRAGFICLDGKTRCFDNNADGSVRSDAINVLFVQKARDAKRIYSQVYHVNGNYATNPKLDDEFMPTREVEEIEEFLEAFYSGIGLDPSRVDYVEAYGSAIKQADGNELEAVGRVFGKEKPIHVGCVKSNMGHSEPASGTCALTKACLAFKTGIIPANLHYEEPQNHIPSVRDGKIHVVTENTPFDRNGFIALNNFSYTGANLHILLKGHFKPKDPERYKSSIPELVLISARQEAGVQKILDALKDHPIDPEEIGLLRRIHSIDISGHMARGYIILDTNENNETTVLSENAEYYPGSTHPVWFVYSGMGSQWAGMGAELMRIPIFAAAIEKCHKVLEPKGIDIVRILTDPDKTIYDNILNSFVGIAAVQIGLTDILKALGIEPDNIIGHSVGELGCAYADGCFTAEEMILSAYSRGLVSVQTPFIRGSMAAVGLGYKSVLALCPPEIEVACHNSSESSTISGPADIMKTFVASLTSKGIFAKEVPCSNIAYHSRYIAEAGPGLLKYLGEVITDPKPRSQKWVSTSVPQDKWEDPIAKFSSAEYHTNNLLNSVLFEETSKLIPPNATVIEIAPHGLLQAILKRSLNDCTHVPLTRRGHSDPVKYMLEAFGKLFEVGLYPKVDILYPKIEFPVSTDTPLLSHLVDWQHTENWPVATYFSRKKMTSIARTFVMSICDDDYLFMDGHTRNGSHVFPEAGLLVLLWETVAMHKNLNYKDMSVVFENISFHGEANIRSEVPLRLGVMIHKGDNKFDVSYEGVNIITGFVKEAQSSELKYRDLDEPETIEDEIILSKEDIYKIMELRGFTYKRDMKSIQTLNLTHRTATVTAVDEWILLLDSLIQFNTIVKNHNGTSVPKLIKRLSINVEEHKKLEPKIENGVSTYDAKIYDIYGITRCGGIELDGLEFVNIPKPNEEPHIIETRSFVPHFITGDVDVATSLLINLQVIANNTTEKTVKITEVIDTTLVLSNVIQTISSNIVSNDFDIHIIQGVVDFDNIITIDRKIIMESDVVIVNNLLGNEKKIKSLYDVLKKNAFVLAFEQDTNVINSTNNKLFSIVTTMAVDKRILMLLKRNEINKKENITYLSLAHDNTFSWVSKLEKELKTTKHIVLVSERQPFCGLIGLVKELRKKYGHKISLVVVDDYNAPAFDSDSSVYREQLQKNLTFNILKKGQWGGYYYLPSSKSTNLRNVTLVSTISGDLDGLTWVEASSSPPTVNTVQVCYAGLSIKDAQTALGMNNMNVLNYGMDFSGIDTNDERVMGLLPVGAIASTVEADTNLLWPVPENWSLEEAATVPLPYALALYCLAIKADIKPGFTIFVSDGLSAFGQAVISLCLNIQCIVFTTVDSQAKKEFLLKLFPAFKENNIADSRDTTFQSVIKYETHNKRCDIVINTFTGAKRQSAMECVGFSGNFFDVSQYDMYQNNKFGMAYLFEEKSYVGVNIETIFRPEYSEIRKRLQLLVSENIAKGIIKPLSRMVYSPLDVKRAFRVISNNVHRGQVLIRMKDPKTTSEGFNVLPRMNYSSNGSYVIITNESGLAIELADHLVMRGARKLVLHTQSSTATGYLHFKLTTWRKSGISVKLSSENLETQAGCTNLFKEGTKLGVIQGIFYVQDSEMDEENPEPQHFAQKFNETALIVSNLDLISRNLCPELSHFVVISRFVQNVCDEYAASAAEKICEARNEICLPALTLRIAMDELERFPNRYQSNIKPQSVSAVLNALDVSLKLKYSAVLTYNLKKLRESDFVERISKVLGKQNMNESVNTNTELTIEDLGLNEITEEIKTIIKEFYNIHYPTEVILKMTIERLKTIGDSLVIPTTNFDGGLGAFIRFIDKDECQAAEPMEALPTLLSNATEKEEDLNPKATYLMLIPGFEGHYEMFWQVCERLKVQSMVFQLTPDLTDESIPQMAASIMKFIKKRFELKSKFYLLGYSFGVNVVLELAALFEKEGHVGVVYCLDSSPDALRIQLDAYLGKLSETELQNTIIQHMYKLMSGKESVELAEKLEKIDDWHQKIETCIISLRDAVNYYSHEYKRTLLNSAYRRILLSRKYEPDFVLESEIVLMKGIPHPKAAPLPHDYNLHKYSKQPIKIYDLKCDHALATQDCRVSCIINKHLEPSLLEEFNQKNRCETYFADSHKFM